MTEGVQDAKPLAEYSRTIMIPIDASEHSQRAFDYYMSNLFRYGDALVFVHVLEPAFEGLKSPIDLLKGGSSTTKLTDFTPVTETRIKSAQDLCEKFLSLCRESGVPLHQASILLDSRPGEALVKACKDYNVDLVVMGNRGLGHLKRVFVGTVSDYLLHHAGIPILIVPPK